MPQLWERNTCPVRIRCLCLLRSPCGQMRKTRQEPSLCHPHTLCLSLQRLTICPYLLRDQLGFGVLSEFKHTHTEIAFACAWSVACVRLVCVAFPSRKSSALSVCACSVIFMVLTCRGCFQSFWDENVWRCVFFACSLGLNLCVCVCLECVVSSSVLDMCECMCVIGCRVRNCILLDPSSATNVCQSLI